MSKIMISNSLMSTYQRYPIRLVKGKGSYVWDENGQKYLDFTSGIATCNLGHVPESIKQAIENQLEQMWHCSNLYHIPVQEKLAHLLTEHSFGDQVFFCNSGAEANEAAIKLARIYSKKIKGYDDKFEIVTFTQSFHGRTLATLSATGQRKIQEGFDPLMPGFRYLPYNDMDSLKDLVSRQTCAVMLELVQGEGGVTPANKDWVQRIYQLCQTHGLLLIIDEVQTGMGRTGTLFAYEQYGVEPDIMTLAKGLASGIPIGAVVAKKEVSDAFSPGSHGSTFGGNPISATAAYATISYMIKENVVSHVIALSEYLQNKLNGLQKQFSFIQEIRGVGLLQGIELKRSVQAKTIIDSLRERGVLVLPAGEHVVRILPPLTVTIEEINELLTALERTFSNLTNSN